VGQNVLVHFNPDRPAHACIAYGWHAWSIGLPLFLIGMGLQGWGSLRRSRRGFVAQVAGWTLAPLGFASLGLIRDVLHPSELPTAAAIAAAVFAASLGLHRAHSRGRIILNRRSR
jgi:4-amino-4-deoxy-L-arabinose transferase-like glycosyltransferase